MSASPERQAVEVDGRRMVLTHLDRVIFPSSGHAKAQLLRYYAQVAPVMVPHAAGRPASFVRAPEGPDGQIWFAKRPPNGRSTQGVTGDGFGFSWPADFPMARIDQIMVKGIEPTSSWVLPATGSDHRPVAARVAIGSRT